jgi:hypothetical protein
MNAEEHRRHLPHQWSPSQASLGYSPGLQAHLVGRRGGDRFEWTAMGENWESWWCWFAGLSGKRTGVGWEGVSGQGGRRTV